MGTNSNSPEKYWRAGIALPVDRKPIFEGRLQELGLETLGDLTTIFCLAPGVVEALKPIVEQYKASKVSAKTVAERRKAAANRLKNMTPEQIELLLAQVSTTEAQE